MNELRTWLEALTPVDLETIDATARLQTRKDRKYVVDARTLLTALRNLTAPIRILEIDGQRWFGYESIYFDSPGLDSYRLAARRRPNRFKVRARTYLDHDTTMIEVKTKNRAGETVKHRTPFHGEPDDLLQAVRDHAEGFAEAAPYAPTITPSLTSTYQRATLLLPFSSERVTIDAHFGAIDDQGRHTGLDDELIVETKTSGAPSALDRCLWAAGERPLKLSKYATSMAALRPELPANKWHRTLRRHFPAITTKAPDLSPTPDPHRAPRNAGTSRSRGAGVAASALALLLVVGCSDASPTDVAAAVSAVDEAGTDGAAVSVSGQSGVFDASSVHSISVEFSDTDYAAMIETYTSTDEKDWIEATVTIDGVTYEQAGIRLKGNSSLRGITTGGGGNTGDATADDPSSLPWLIKLDKYVDDQNHEGINDFVVRSNTSETALNEAVALDLLEAAGLATQDAIAVRFSVNGSAEALRLVIEHPDDVWMAENFDASGALYKAESTGDYSYRGDDPESYDEVFDQEAGKDNTDLTPLIEFLDFINNSDDATFAAELGERLDVDAFATYLAMQEIVDNFDDIDGPGNNSYLYYDTATQQFTVVPWDYNLAFGAVNAPGGTTPGGNAPGGGFAGPAGGGQARPGPAAGGGALGGSNVLVERFLQVDEFAALYTEQLTELDEALIESGLAEDILDQWTATLQEGASDIVAAEVIATEATALAQSL
jgi:spore coat protein CotH